MRDVGIFSSSEQALGRRRRSQPEVPVTHRAVEGALEVGEPDEEVNVQLTDYPVTIAVEEAGELVGMSRSAAYRAAARGQLPTVRLGRRLRVPTAKFLTMLGLDREQAVDLVDGHVRRLVGPDVDGAA